MFSALTVTEKILLQAQNPPPANYMSIQKEITPHMRAVLINWLIEVLI